MIYSVTGKLLLVEPGFAVVEAGGVGYRCSTTTSTLAFSGRTNRSACTGPSSLCREGPESFSLPLPASPAVITWAACAGKHTIAIAASIIPVPAIQAASQRMFFCKFPFVLDFLTVLVLSFYALGENGY